MVLVFILFTQRFYVTIPTDHEDFLVVLNEEALRIIRRLHECKANGNVPRVSIIHPV